MCIFWFSFVYSIHPNLAVFVVGGVKAVQERAKHVVLAPLSALELGVLTAVVHALQVLDGDHSVPRLVQLIEGLSYDLLSRV